MKTKLKIACTLTCLSLAGSVIAEASPSAVTGVTATANGSDVTVSWSAVTSDPIAYYRVYYSGQSILENEGLFDDFETTDGSETTLTFPAPIGVSELYVAIIAVADTGLESDVFTEEAHVSVETVSAPPPATPPVAAPKTPTPAVQAEQDAPGNVRLLKAEVLSPTEIVTTFSAAITVEEQGAPDGLKIEGPDDSLLQIKNITIDGKTITIVTETQTRGMVYNVQYSEPFIGRKGQPLDSNDRSALVTGHSDGAEPPAAPVVREVNPIAPPDVTNATIEPQVQPNGAYTITMKWDVDNAPGDLYGIVVYQTRDGQNFGPPSLLPIDIGGLQLHNVTPGFFGLYVQTINMYGYVSSGVFQYANLPQYVPGYGFYGNLTYGTTDSDGNELSHATDEPIEEADTDGANEEIATLEVITDDTPMQELEGVDHSAAAEMTTTINWKNAAILAAGTSVVIIMLISAFVFIPRATRGSGDA